MTHYDPEFEEMARAFRLELQAEQAELEELERESDIQSMDLFMALLESQWRGDQIRLLCGSTVFQGSIIHVGQNLVTLAAMAGAMADVCLDRCDGYQIVEPGRGNGVARRDKDPVRFAARLRELAGVPNQVVEVGTSDGAPVATGRLAEVRADHVLIIGRDNGQWIVPLHAIAYCVRAPLGR